VGISHENSLSAYPACFADAGIPALIFSCRYRKNLSGMLVLFGWVFNQFMKGETPRRTGIIIQTRHNQSLICVYSSSNPVN
jgi:hypothetical protein